MQLTAHCLLPNSLSSWGFVLLGGHIRQHSGLPPGRLRGLSGMLGIEPRQTPSPLYSCSGPKTETFLQKDEKEHG